MTSAEHAKFIDLMYQLRARPQFSRSFVIFFFENNNNNTTTRDWAHLVQSDPIINARSKGGNVYVWPNKEHDPPGFGVRTTNFTKTRMKELAQVSISNRNLLIYNNLILSRGVTSDEFLHRLADQLCNFAMHPKVSPTDPAKTPTFSYHGKGYGEQDDAAMALLLVIYWSTAYLNDPKLVQQRDCSQYGVLVDMGTRVLVPLAIM
jgi:hypothetical protein